MITVFWCLLTWLAFGVLHWTHALASARIGHACGATVEEVKVGYGPTLFRRTVGDVVYQGNLVPFFASTQFANERDEATEAGSDDARGTPFERLPLASRILILASGPTSSLLLGMLLWAVALTLPGSEIVVDPAGGGTVKPTGVPGLTLTGRAATVDSEARLFRDGFVGFWKRVLTVDLLDGWGGVLAWVVTCVVVATQAPAAWLTCFGASCLGNWALNLVPIPPLSGGQIVWACLEAVIGRPLRQIQGGVYMLGLLVIILFFLRVCYADVLWFARWAMTKGG